MMSNKFGQACAPIGVTHVGWIVSETLLIVSKMPRLG